MTGTIYFALDNIDTNFRVGGGHGNIAGMDVSEAGLRAQGFANPPYRGNRLVTMEVTASGWDPDCEPGWYYTTVRRTPQVQISRPLTGDAAALATLRAEAELTLDQIAQWGRDVEEYAPGHPELARGIGHDYLWLFRRSMYVVVRNEVDSTDLSVAQRTAWVQAMREGFTDVSTAPQFYGVFDALTDYPSRDTLIACAMPADATRVAIASAVTISPANDPPVPSTVELAKFDWLADVTA